MGIFGRKRPIGADRAGEPEPVLVDAADLTRAAGLLADFESSVSSDAAVRAAVSAIALAGGAISLERRIQHIAAGGSSEFDRPWHWLAAVAREAYAVGNLTLVAHVILFVNVWTTSYEPLLGLGDYIELLLDPAPAAIRADIYTVAMYALPAMNPSDVIVDHPTGRIDVHGLLVLCCLETVKPTISMPPDLVDRAHRILT